jgi:hypothetical protein
MSGKFCCEDFRPECGLSMNDWSEKLTMRLFTGRRGSLSDDDCEQLRIPAKGTEMPGTLVGSP